MHVSRLRWESSVRNPVVLFRAGTSTPNSILLTAAGDAEANVTLAHDFSESKLFHIVDQRTRDQS